MTTLNGSFDFFNLFGNNPSSPGSVLDNNIDTLIKFSEQNQGKLPTVQNMYIICKNPFLQEDQIINALAKRKGISVKISVLRCT